MTATESIENDNPFMFTGREWDRLGDSPEANVGTGLYYYRARYYSWEMGRFISEDPIGLAGGINMYAYVGNSPLNFIDPLGLDTYSIGVFGNAAFGFGGGGGLFINIGHSAQNGWSFSITGTAQGGAIAGGGAFIGGAFNYTTACNVNQLNGTATQFGRSGLFNAAVEAIRGPNYWGGGIMGGVGAGYTANSLTASTTSAIVQYQDGVLSFGNSGTDSIWSYDFGE
jgi:RHS repeat-associated protein